MKGRKPKPTALRLIEGNREHRTIHAELEPTPDTAPPPCPAILKGQARKHWDYLIGQLQGMHTLGTSDQGTIMAAAICYGQAIELQKEVNTLRRRKDKTPTDMKSLVNIERAMGRILRDLVSHEANLGLNPTARTRIRLERPQPKSRLERLLS